MSEAIKVEIILDRPSKTFSRGDTVAGKVVIRSKKTSKYSGVKIILTGVLTLERRGRRNSNFDEPRQIEKIQLINRSLNIGGAGSVSALRDGEVGFALEMREEEGGDVRVLPESYRGVLVNVEYKLTAEVKLPGILLLNKIATTSVEILVQKSPSESGRVGMLGRRIDFHLTPDTISSRDRMSENAIRKAPDFDFKGHLDSDLVAINGKRAISGEIVVGKSCEAKVKSIDLQLVRMEWVAGGSGEKTGTEVMTIQIADGDPPRDLPIPLRLVLPRKHFVCESAHFPGLFSLDFELNVVAVFGKNFAVAENVPLTIVRHEIK